MTLLHSIPSFVQRLQPFILIPEKATLDHVHYRATSMEEYSKILIALVDISDCIGQEEISGRLIATLVLHQPIAGVSSIELSQPKPNQQYFGLQQLGLVIASFDVLTTRAPLILKDGNPLYPRYHQKILIDNDVFEIKYATKTLEEVTKEEQSQG